MVKSLIKTCFVSHCDRIDWHSECNPVTWDIVKSVCVSVCVSHICRPSFSSSSSAVGRSCVNDIDTSAFAASYLFDSTRLCFLYPSIECFYFATGGGLFWWSHILEYWWNIVRWYWILTLLPYKFKYILCDLKILSYAPTISNS